MRPALVEERLRRFMLAILIFSILGTSAELVLARHYEGFWKALPLGLFSLALVVLLVHWWRPGNGNVRAFQATMILFIFSGCLGVYWHYRGKAEFALERNQSLGGLELLRESVFKGINPPLLAPGTMIALGLLGLAWTCRVTTQPSGGIES